MQISSSPQQLQSKHKPREVLCIDAVDWILGSDAPLAGSIFTGIPDIKDIPLFNNMKNSTALQRTEDYLSWSTALLDALFRRLAIGQVAIFNVTDAKVMTASGDIVCWVDKSHLCSLSASKHQCNLLWHKIAINSDHQDNCSPYRPSYTHLLCYGKQMEYKLSQFRTPDVFDRGAMSWAKAIGLDACIMGVAFLRNVVGTPVVIDPFCGHGTILAVANYFGLPSLGIEICVRRARQALARDVSSIISQLSATRLKQLGIVSADNGAYDEDKCMSEVCTNDDQDQDPNELVSQEAALLLACSEGSDVGCSGVPHTH